MQKTHLNTFHFIQKLHKMKGVYFEFNLIAIV